MFFLKYTCSVTPGGGGGAYLGGGAAGPLGGRHPAARVPLGAAELPRGVTWYGPGVLLLLLRGAVGPYHCGLRARLLTGAGLHVAGVALRAAVLSVGAADGLKGDARVKPSRRRRGEPEILSSSRVGPGPAGSSPTRPSAACSTWFRRCSCCGRRT